MVQHESDARLMALLNAALDGIMIIDALGAIQTFNPACERLFGYEAGEVLGRNVKMLMPSPYAEEHDLYLQRYRRTGEKRIIGIGREVRGRRKDGSVFPLYLSVGQGHLNGETMFVGIIQDRTAEHRAERRYNDLQLELFHSARLSAMGQMTSALAHELNQPLTAVTNYVGAARHLLSAGSAEQVAKANDLLERATGQIARAGGIIRRLRDFVEKGETARAPEDLNHAVEEAAALSFSGIADLNVKLELKLRPALPLIMMDKIQVQQVIVNLARNAIDAMQSVEDRRVIVSTDLQDGESAVVTVADSGPGIPPEVMDRLFQPFVTTKESGMGIGLSICRSIIESHGGSLWAEPSGGPGAIFRFRLPLATLSP